MKRWETKVVVLGNIFSQNRNDGRDDTSRDTSLETLLPELRYDVATFGFHKLVRAVKHVVNRFVAARAPRALVDTSDMVAHVHCW